MRELTFDDMDLASGGIVQFIPLAVAMGSTFAKGGAGWFLGGVGIGMAVHSMDDDSCKKE